MPSLADTWHGRRLVAAAFLAGLLGVGALAWRLTDPATLNLQDFVEYWAAARLNAGGSNPYDSEVLYRQERTASPHLTEAIMMWNPPWTLSLAAPFGLLPARPAHTAWLALQLALVLACAAVVWRLYGGVAETRWVAWAVSLGFVPTFFVLRMGQISPVVLVGVVGFLLLERRGRYGWAGAAFALATFKPHLALLPGVVLALWAVDRRRWAVVGGGALALVALTVGPLACNPGLLQQYRDALSHQPPQMLSPTLGSLLRLAFGIEHFRLQFLPTAVGLGWAVGYYLRRRGSWDWVERMPALLLAAFLTASYGAWPFDLVVLLVPVLQAAAWIVRDGWPATALYGLVALLGFDLTALLMMNVRYSDYYWYAWMTPLLLFAYLSVRRQTSPVAAGWSARLDDNEADMLDRMRAVASS